MMTTEKYLAQTLRKTLKSDTTVRMSGKVLRDFIPYANGRGYKVFYGGGSIPRKGWYKVGVSV